MQTLFSTAAFSTSRTTTPPFPFFSHADGSHQGDDAGDRRLRNHRASDNAPGSFSEQREALSWSFAPGTGARPEADTLRLQAGAVRMNGGKQPPAPPVCEGIVQMPSTQENTGNAPAGRWRRFEADLRVADEGVRAPGGSTQTRYFAMSPSGQPEGAPNLKATCRYPATSKAEGRVVRALIEMRDELRNRSGSDGS